MAKVINIACVYHSIDLDGWMSAAIVKIYHKEYEQAQTHSVDFIGYNYGDTVPDLSMYNEVIMCDISFPMKDMEALYSKLKYDFVWIDHHISAINEAAANKLPITGIRSTGYAACELTWLYYYPTTRIPEIARLIGRYDCFGHVGTYEETYVKEFQFGARSHITDMESAYQYLNANANPTNPDDYKIVKRIHENGRVIYSYLEKEAHYTFSKRLEKEVLIPNYNNTGKTTSRLFAIINVERFNPYNFNIKYSEFGLYGIISYHFNGNTNKWHFSIYSDNPKVDVSRIAKQFGGGGHKGAAGFVLDNYKKFTPLADV